MFGFPKDEGNSQKLEQVMINLIQNAADALTDIDKSNPDNKTRTILIITLSPELNL